MDQETKELVIKCLEQQAETAKYIAEVTVKKKECWQRYWTARHHYHMVKLKIWENNQEGISLHMQELNEFIAQEVDYNFIPLIEHELYRSRRESLLDDVSKLEELRDRLISQGII